MKKTFSNIFTASLLCFLTGCAALPQLFQATTEIADDTAIKILVSKEAITKETNVNIYVDIENKTPPPPVPKP